MIKSKISAGVPLLLCLVLVVAGPFAFDTYMVNTLIKAFFFAIAAITVDLLWGYTGYLTFGQSAFFGAGAYCAGLIFTHLGFSNEYALLAAITSIVVPGLMALFVGWLSFYHGAAAFFSCVISLVVPIVIYQLVLSGGDFTGSSSGLTGFETFDFEIESWYWIAGAIMLFVAIASDIFVKSDAGKILIAIRDNEQRCEYLGLNTYTIKTLLLGACGAIAGFAGFSYGAFSGVVAPELTSFSFGTEMIIWVALSGRGTLWGPVIGTILITLISSYLSNSIPFVWQLILGLGFVAVIVFLPKGLLPYVLKSLSQNKNSGSQVKLEEAKIRDNNISGHAIVMNHVSKSYGKLDVLKDITLTGDPGELIGIIGPNGAGKTTLMRCMGDGEHRTGGSVEICGHDLGKKHPEDIVRLGLGRKFQNANIFQSLTVSECLRIARTELDTPSFIRKSDKLKLPSYVLDVMKVTGLVAKLDTVAKDLSHGEQQALELSMVLALEPKVVLLDEPTAGLTLSERRDIGKIFSALAGKYRICCLLVEHDLDFVKEIATKIVVLYHGTILMQGNVNEVVNSKLVQDIYTGSKANSASAGSEAGK